MKPVNIVEAAETDIIGTAAWYDLQAPGLGDSFIGRVDAVIEQLRYYPDMYQVIFGPVRRAILHRFPFAVLYHVRPASVEVLGVLPCRADPAVLKQRIAALRNQ